MLTKWLPPLDFRLPLGLACSRPSQEHFREVGREGGKLTMSNLHSSRLLEVLEVSMLVEMEWREDLLGLEVLEVSMMVDRE